LLENQDLCVLATAGPAGPHASLMGFLPAPDLGHIYLLTPSQTRKYQNILHNPLVSLLVDDRGKSGPGASRALTIAGHARPLADPEARARLLGAFGRRLPHLADIMDDPSTVLLEVAVCSFKLLEGPVNALEMVLE